MADKIPLVGNPILPKKMVSIVLNIPPLGTTEVNLIFLNKIGIMI